MKTALVLEGGAKRGIYTAGVLDVLLENGIMTDGVLGVSAGAIRMLHGRRVGASGTISSMAAITVL